MAGTETTYVWIWLPGATDPVVAGRLDRAGAAYEFTYGRSYLDRPDAVALYLPELPLESGPQAPMVGALAGCLRDAGPDSWGRRVIDHRHTADRMTTDANELDYLIESGSDRIGALDFQLAPDAHVARGHAAATLDDLAAAAERVERGEPLPAGLDLALLHGSSVGGARPKVLLSDGDRQLIAKLGSTSDHYPVVQAELVAMELARRVGLRVAPVELTRALGKLVLLVERFDRPPEGGRRAMVSALTILGLDELGGRYARYSDLGDAIRARFTDPDATLRELFARITFNILVGNSDDHAKNHAAFWDGESLSLTPAYDVCPQPRAGEESAQAMAIAPGVRASQVALCVEHAAIYHLDRTEARAVIDQQIEVIHRDWTEVADLAQLGQADRDTLWGRQILNPFATYGY